MTFTIKNTNDLNFLSEEDISILEKFNIKKNGTNAEIKTNLLPEPFIGNPLKAKVLLLALNPGFEGSEKKWHADEKFARLIKDNIEFKESGYPYYYLNEHKDFDGNPGHIWCKRIFKELIAELGAKDLSKKIACVQYHGYHSKKYSPIGKTLPSQEQTFELVKATMKLEIPIVLMRSKKIWFAAITGLETYEHLIILNNPRNPTISRGNMQAGSFDNLLETLKKN